MEDFDIFINNKKYPNASQIFAIKVKSKHELKDDCIFIIDTNALLIPYTVSSNNLKTIFELFKKLIKENRLFIPGHVAREFANNRPSKLIEVYQKLVRYRDNFQIPKLDNHPILQGIPEYEDLLQKEKEHKNALKSLREEIQKIISIVEDWNWNDPISLNYSSFFNESIIIDLEIKEDELKKKLRRRYTHKIPPGYKDNTKDDEGIGDLLIWETIIKICNDNNKDVIFITGDKKADWKHRSEKKGLYTRFELISEFKQKCNDKDILLLELSEVLELFNIDPEIVKEVKTIEDEFGIMIRYLNKSGNSPITHYEIGNDFIIVRFKGGKDYTYSYEGKARKYNVDIMKSLAVSGKGLSAYITRNVKYSYD